MLGIFGRRRSTALSTAARKRRLTAAAREDIVQSEEEIARLQSEIDEMRQDLEGEAQAIADKWAANLEEVQVESLKPRPSDVDMELVALAWVPYWEIGYRSARGSLTRDRVPAWA